MAWLLLVAPVAALLILIGYWHLVLAEGAYLGPRAVRLLYDWTARGYDRLKGFDAATEAYFLGRPLAAALRSWERPRVLDVATGTGRLPRTLLAQPNFRGWVCGLDLSARMLRIAQQHLARRAGQAGLLQAAASPLPFAAEQFEAVCCLEAMEFFADAGAALDDMVRVLRPGGWLLITNRVGWEARLLPGRTWSRRELISLLRERPLTDISVRPWQVYYDLVWARKRGGCH